MAYRHSLQASRFELKYLVDERCARNIRDFIRGYLVPDEHAEGRPNNSYLVNSLYLDTPTLALYRQTRQGLKNRVKLRIRFYDDDPTSPAFLEIKRREANVILKQRAAVTREGGKRVLHKLRPRPSQIVQIDGNRNPLVALEHFCDLSETLGADGACYVFYMREAYVSPESDQLRITFDRHLKARMYDRIEGLKLPSEGVSPRVGGVILEIKFTDRFPNWIGNLIQVFNLQRRSVAKYCYCVQALGLTPARWLGAEREFVR